MKDSQTIKTNLTEVFIDKNNIDNDISKETYVLPNGDKYAGQWKNGVIHGQGRYICKNGKEYIGEWKDGKMSGMGVIKWPNGSKYVGEWENGEMEGHGSYTWPYEITYEGEWKKGKICGHGFWYMSNSQNALFNGKALDSRFASLIITLINDGITSLDEVKKLNILKYLNKKNLYDYSMRMKLLSEINKSFGIDANKAVNNKVIKSHGEGLTVSINEQPNKRNYLTDNREVIILKEIENYLKLKGGVVSFEALRKFKPTIMRRSLLNYLDDIPDVISLKGNYIHRDNICGFDDFAEMVLTKLKSLFSDNNGHTTAFMLFSSVQARLEDFFFDNGFESVIEVYELTQHLFEKEKYMGNSFIFNRSFHIWENEPDYPKSYAGLFIKWARENDGIISRAHCYEKLKAIGASSIDSLFTNTYYKTRHLLWQYEPYGFVLAECFETSDHWKAAFFERLNTLFIDIAFVPLRDIADHWFETLPPIPTGVKWSPLLLQEIVTYVEVGFRSIPAGRGQSIDAVHAVIAPIHSNIETFGDVVWRVVDEDFGTPTKVVATEELRQLLVNRNILLGNERLTSLHKAIGDDLRFGWIDNHSKVKVFNI